MAGRSRKFLRGRSGADYLNGDQGDDVIDGGAGDDTIVGGRGRDLLIGGEGADKFAFQSRFDVGIGFTRDVIRDFEVGLDTLSFEYFGQMTVTIAELGLDAGSISLTLVGDGTIDGEVELLIGRGNTRSGRSRCGPS